MKARRKTLPLLNALILGSVLSGPAAMGQITGELVEPDIMLLIDTSGSMDWANNTPADRGSWNWATEQCIASNTEGQAFEKTSWQKMLDSFLGGIDGDGFKCAVEPPGLRPSLHAIDSVNIDDYIKSEDGDNYPDNISEFRRVSWSHFRAVNCPNPDYWVPTRAGSDYYQCINTDNDNPSCVPADPGCPTDYEVEDIAVVGNKTNTTINVKCRKKDIYTVVATGANYCLDLHPDRENRQSGGILDRYENTARFGVMTFDNVPACLGSDCSDHDRAWDYGDCRTWACQGEGDVDAHMCYGWNAGARADEDGAVGGIVGIGSNMLASNESVRNVLETMEPLNCSPLGAILDDAGRYFATDLSVLPKDEIGGSDQYYRCRPKLVILITDGQPTSAFEFTTGLCGDTADWKPDILDDSTDGCDTDTSDDTVFDCPWRSSPEEAGELFDVSIEALNRMERQPDDQPVFLVVIGFNVPDVDCEVTPEDCYAYTADYYDNKHCYADLPVCGGGSGADGGSSDAGAGDDTCLMTPRQFLNEIACQGWPWDPARVYGTHETDIQPTWLDPCNEFCAASGYSGDPDAYICLDGERALFANSATTLSKVLDLVMGSLSPTVATRTDLVLWNKPLTSASDSDVTQYEFRSGYIARQGRPWQGVLTCKDWSCEDKEDTTGDNPATPDEEEQSNLMNIAEMLENQGSRNIYSLAEPTGVPARLDSGDYTQFDINSMLDWVNQGGGDLELKALGDNDFDDCDFGLRDEVGDVCEDNVTIKNEVLPEILNRGLADIYNSTPAVLGKPLARLPVHSFIEYKSDITVVENRSPHLFVGTNDGMLHAFDIDQISEGGDTVEKWGYIPRSVLKHVRDQFPIPDIVKEYGSGSPASIEGYRLASETTAGIYQHLFLFDGSPLARDVLLVRNPAELMAEVKEQWRAIVFGSLGKGARGYYALDVTDVVKGATVKPSLRWELSPDDNLFGNNEWDDGNGEKILQIKEMGYPLSRPLLAYVGDTDASGKPIQVAAAVLPGGWNSDSSPNGNTGVYIVRLGDGKLIKYFKPSYGGDTSSGMCADSVGLETDPDDSEILIESAQLVGEPTAFHGSQSLRLARQILIGDDRGRLWMIEMPGENPAGQSTGDDKYGPWCLRLYFDTMIAWHYPYDECWPRTADDQLSDCDPEPLTCFHDDCCATTDGEEVVPSSKCAENEKAPRNMNGPRVMILGAPTIAMDHRDDPVIVFGTGQYDNLSGWNRNRIFSITDDKDDTDGDGLRAEINWWIGDSPVDDTIDEVSNALYRNWLNTIDTAMTLTHVDFGNEKTGVTGENLLPQYFWNVGEKLIGRPVVFDSVAYFTTFVPIEEASIVDDACEAGSSRIWALNYNYKKDPADSSLNLTTIDFSACTVDACAFGEFASKMFDSYTKELLSGVQVVRRPACDSYDEDVFQIVAQKANPLADIPSEGNTPPPDMVNIRTQTISKGAGINLPTVEFDSWSIVFE
ncbi:MAG: hypothetical protein GY847_02275 [Proteobacteria bacterium]|nr:hypothetical protein [Pseudomonadota bacterium]